MNILNSYNEIWHHPEFSSENVLNIHFLPGLESEAACLNVNFAGGVALIPSELVISPLCNNLQRISPAALTDKFRVVVAVNDTAPVQLIKLISQIAS